MMYTVMLPLIVLLLPIIIASNLAPTHESYCNGTIKNGNCPSVTRDDHTMQSSSKHHPPVLRGDQEEEDLHLMDHIMVLHLKCQDNHHRHTNTNKHHLIMVLLLHNRNMEDTKEHPPLLPMVLRHLHLINNMAQRFQHMIILNNNNSHHHHLHQLVLLLPTVLHNLEDTHRIKPKCLLLRLQLLVVPRLLLPMHCLDILHNLQGQHLHLQLHQSDHTMTIMEPLLQPPPHPTL
mmetsp:Transcript_22322/g.31342  ORF Transcript_22322/g.31342 Transcript_22322/m.31342 type:complete len:233 (+) Transcript_22322:453-1151(+)